jgi:fungal nitric oxide reductase
MVEPLFVKDHIKSMAPYIQKTVDDLLEAMIAKAGSDPVDIIENFALPVPSYVRLILYEPEI